MRIRPEALSRVATDLRGDANLAVHLRVAPRQALATLSYLEADEREALAERLARAGTPIFSLPQLERPRPVVQALSGGSLSAVIPDFAFQIQSPFPLGSQIQALKAAFQDSFSGNALLTSLNLTAVARFATVTTDASFTLGVFVEVSPTVAPTGPTLGKLPGPPGGTTTVPMNPGAGQPHTNNSVSPQELGIIDLGDLILPEPSVSKPSEHARYHTDQSAVCNLRARWIPYIFRRQDSLCQAHTDRGADHPYSRGPPSDRAGRVHRWGRNPPR